jgi:hypothetical protein
VLADLRVPVSCFGSSVWFARSHDVTLQRVELLGVYSAVYICIGAQEPLPAERRCAIVELCREHELLFGPCAIAVPDHGATRARILTKLKRLLTFDIGSSRAASPFVRAALRAYGGMTAGTEGLVILEEAAAGPWMVEKVRELSTAFAVGSSCPKWNGETQDGGFSYLGSDAPFAVHVSNAYEAGPRTNPHVSRDGYVGDFFDVMVLSSRAAPDGRAVASSSFVKALKKRLGVQVTCRAGYW